MGLRGGHLLAADGRYQRRPHRIGAPEAQPASDVGEVAQPGRPADAAPRDRPRSRGAEARCRERPPHPGPRPTPASPRGHARGGWWQDPSAVREARQITPCSKRMVGSRGPCRSSDSVASGSTSKSSWTSSSTTGAWSPLLAPVMSLVRPPRRRRGSGPATTAPRRCSADHQRRQRPLARRLAAPPPVPYRGVARARRPTTWPSTTAITCIVHTAELASQSSVGSKRTRAEEVPALLERVREGDHDALALSQQVGQVVGRRCSPRLPVRGRRPSAT